MVSSEGHVKRAAMNEVIVFGGCDKACARKIVEMAGVPVYQHLMIPELGIEKKNGDRSFTQEEVESITSVAWKGDGIIQNSKKESYCSSIGCGCSKN